MKYLFPPLAKTFTAFGRGPAGRVLCNRTGKQHFQACSTRLKLKIREGVRKLVKKLTGEFFKAISRTANEYRISPSDRNPFDECLIKTDKIALAENDRFASLSKPPFVRPQK